MDIKEQDEKIKKLEEEYARYLRAKYFSDKDIYGGIIFNEESAIDGMTIKRSSGPITKSYADPVSAIPRDEGERSSDSLIEIPANVWNEKKSAKKTGKSKAPSTSKHL